MGGRSIGWLLLSLAAALIPIALSARMICRATPRRERLDFEEAGNPGHWTLDSLAKLSGPVGIFLRQWAGEPDLASRVDWICEQLAEVDAQTAQLSEHLAQLVRTTLASGTLISITMLTNAIARADRLSCAWALAPVLACGTSGFFCNWMGRLASVDVANRRRAWDALCQAVLPPHMSRPRTGAGFHTTTAASRSRK